MTEDGKVIQYRLTDSNAIRIDNHARLAYFCDGCGTVHGDIFKHMRFYHEGKQPQVMNVKAKVRGKLE